MTTSTPDVAERVRALREYGWRTREDAEELGINARLDELQAAVLRVMLPGLNDATLRRRTIAGAYLDGLAGVKELELPAPAAGSESAWHLFVVRHPRRDSLAAALARCGVATAVHYATPPPLHSAFHDGRSRAGAFPVSERHANTALTLPLHPGISDAELQHVIDTVHREVARV